MPQQTFKGIGFPIDQRTRHVIQQIDFLALEYGKRALCQFYEQNNRDPLRRCTDRATDHQIQINIAGNHHNRHEQRAHNGLAIEPMDKFVWLVEQIAILFNLLKLRIFLWFFVFVAP